MRHRIDTPVKEKNGGGGVHKYSGIPSKAFYYICEEWAGFSWECPGYVWYRAMLRLNPEATFEEFANLTVQEADHYDLGGQAVTEDWQKVGVLV